MSKREREENMELLLFVAIPEDPCFYCYTAERSLFTDEHIELLSGSVPFARTGKIPGCVDPHDNESMFDSKIWTRVQQEDVPKLVTVRTIVLGYFSE